MKSLLALALIPLVATTAAAATTAAFDGGADTPLSLNGFNGGLGPTVEAAGGNPGGFLQVTGNVNDQHNFVTFNNTDAGTYSSSTFSFQFRADNLGAGGADGFGFSYMPTGAYGTSGPLGSAPFTAEDPAAAGVLGFGFDTWGNGGALDANANSANYSEITLFWNGAIVSRIDDTRTLPVGAFNLKDGLWHQVNGSVNFAGGTVSLTVDSATLFNNLPVPGLSAYESRIGFAARTGNANERLAIDNLNVQWIPEPGSALLAALAGLGLLNVRRRK